ncbi:protein arginine methyltransferase [Cavenderia fasciculata]|uniref:Protein arginine N-methyltransferase n=1 Tax=Cavenderia fasciculata TaxID=261658 RepID=F4Q537_CACFS|nr:protein arginine methyltransferase [Cavenderia fasciculata]EGG17930.1 protein arginine methyltransferase [Cavenderia fasciculata]|eukprot:XP_004356414.1 protein arginine methyltransferase [Cavenderia fasciculata]
MTNNNNNSQCHGFSCGLDYADIGDLVEEVGMTYNLGFDFLSVPISTKPEGDDWAVQQSPAPTSTIDPLLRSDLLLDSSQWKSVIVPKVSEWIDVDSNDKQTRLRSTAIMKNEISWSAHVAVPALLIPPPKREQSPNYAQVINQSLLSLMNMKMWMRMPLNLTSDKDDENSNKEPLLINTWKWWNNFRMLCNHHPSLFLALEMTKTLPNQQTLEQWLGEPVKCFIIPTSVFEINKAGFPTLSKDHQKFLKQIFKHNIQFIISRDSTTTTTTTTTKDTTTTTTTPTTKMDIKLYHQYIQFLHSNQSPMSDQECLEQPYLDYLQAPLQPLMDNLESQTYEIFEKDPIKYKEYQRAIGKALVKRTGDNETMHTTVMVVGAGRGPLVQAAISASKDVNRPITVYAVEKNPNAIITLKGKLQLNQEWKDRVTIIDSDMRYWRTDVKADIMVSELLGSFGDNELSPECLDGAQRFMAEDGVSIPAWYTSYVAPMSSSRLYNEVANYNTLKSFETPYVVKPHNFYQLAESQPLFTFSHPNESLRDAFKNASHPDSVNVMSVVDNTRFDSLTFNIGVDDATLHGFIGFFDCCLFDDVHISINPANFSTGMFSWFPIYFPIKEPMSVSSKHPITVHFWRNSNRSKVWYEWSSISSSNVTPIHNPSGRSYWIGL